MEEAEIQPALSTSQAGAPGRCCGCQRRCLFPTCLRGCAPEGTLEAPIATVKDGFSREGYGFSRKGLL